jgi:hypothetical protein
MLKNGADIRFIREMYVDLLATLEAQARKENQCVALRRGLEQIALGR